MPMLDFLYIPLGGVLLWFGSDWVVDSAAAIARKFHVSELTIGLTIVAMGTSAPEFLVTMMAAFKGLSDISLANVVGSDVFNLGIILGAIAMVRPVEAHPAIVKRDAPLLLGVGLFLLYAVQDLRLGRAEGAALAVVFAVYLGWLLFQASRHHGQMKGVQPGQGGDRAPDSDDQRAAMWWDYPRLAGGFAAIALGSDLLVDGASAIARAYGVSDWAIGITIVAAGTSLPEFFTALTASIKGKSDMLLGNLIGSDFFNLAGVLGLTCLLRPLNVAQTTLPGMWAMAGFLVVVYVFVLTRKRISRMEGGILVGLGLARWAMVFF